MNSIYEDHEWTGESCMTQSRKSRWDDLISDFELDESPSGMAQLSAAEKEDVELMEYLFSECSEVLHPDLRSDDWHCDSHFEDRTTRIVYAKHTAIFPRMPEDWRADLEVAIAGASYNGHSIHYASEDLQSHPEVIWAAYQSSRSALLGLPFVIDTCPDRLRAAAEQANKARREKAMLEVLPCTTAGKRMTSKI